MCQYCFPCSFLPWFPVFIGSHQGFELRVFSSSVLSLWDLLFAHSTRMNYHSCATLSAERNNHHQNDCHFRSPSIRMLQSFDYLSKKLADTKCCLLMAWYRFHFVIQALSDSNLIYWDQMAAFTRMSQMLSTYLPVFGTCDPSLDLLLLWYPGLWHLKSRCRIPFWHCDVL